MVDFYLLDTDTFIYLTKGDRGILRRIEEVGEDKVALSSITVAELYFGAFKSIRKEENLRHLEEVLSDMPVRNFTSQSARIFGRIRCDLRKKGIGIADFDLAIASVALANQACLVTNNSRHFSVVPDLMMENWVSKPRAGQAD